MVFTAALLVKDVRFWLCGFIDGKNLFPGRSLLRSVKRAHGELPHEVVVKIGHVLTTTSVTLPIPV